MTVRWRVRQDLAGAARDSGAQRDPRLADAIEVLRRARGRDGRWRTYAQYAGRQWFQLEPPGPSRWNTARALRVLDWWKRG